MNHTHSTQHADKPGADAGNGSLVSAILFMCVLLGLLLFWPQVKQWIPGLADPPKVQVLGQVQRSSFVGGWGVRTQVEVETGSLLLRGSVEIERGALVERRVTALDEQLCVVGTNRCHEILSR